MGETIATATGETTPAELGRTLMHEHLVIGWPGWESHTTAARTSPEDEFAICVDRIAELQDLGYSTLLDPCPNDLGRDVELAARVGQQTRFQIIVATGLYFEALGGAPYWKFRAGFDDDVAEQMAEMFIRELTVGVGETGIRAGVIKVATGQGAVTEHERSVLRAAAMASIETGAPITTHTDEGQLGDEQQRLLTEFGVPAHRIVIGHSCGTDDHDYHMGLARGGSYLGFDRFGIDVLYPDEKRVASLVRAVEAGAGDRIVVSHDSVWCWKGQPFPEAMVPHLSKVFDPTHFDRVILPQLREAGLTEAQLAELTVDNPRRFFEGAPLPVLSPALS